MVPINQKRGIVKLKMQNKCSFEIIIFILAYNEKPPIPLEGIKQQLADPIETSYKNRIFNWV